MTFQVDAIYDGGVLKPLQPLALPDQSHVKLTVDAVEATIDAARITEQQAALKELWEILDKLPQVKNDDGWSVRQHDQLLYGNP